MSSTSSLSQVAPVRPEPTTGGALRARLLAVLVAAILPLAAYLAIAAEASRHATLDWLETELHDAATQAAAREAESLGQAGRMLNAVAEQAGASGLCAGLRLHMVDNGPAIAGAAVYRADATQACALSGGAGGEAPVLLSTHVRAALAAGGAMTMAADAGAGLVVSRAVTAADGSMMVASLVLDPMHLPPLGLPLRRDQTSRLLVDPDDGMVLAAQPDHGARAARPLAVPRLLAALRAGTAGVATARDAQGVQRLAGYALLPLEATGVRFAARAGLMIDLPYETLLSEANARRRDQWVAAGSLAVLGAALAWLLARHWLVRPVRALLEPAGGVAADASHEARALAALRPAGTWLRHQGDLAAVADAASEMFLRLDAGLRVTYASPATRRMLGYAPGEVVDAQVSNEPGWEPCLAQVEALRGGDASAVPCRISARRRDDAEVTLEIRANRLSDGGFMLACRDIGGEVALQRELAEARQGLAALALSDPLTGLANRRRFDEALGQELSRARRAQEPISLVLLRLEDWADCAAKLGAEQADEALRQIGRLLTGTLRRPGDLAARLDEGLFGVLLPTTDRIGALRMAERVREAVADAWRQLSYAGLAARIGAGSVLPLGEDDSPNALLDLAVNALQEEAAAHGAALLTPRPAPGLTFGEMPVREAVREVQPT